MPPFISVSMGTKLKGARASLLQRPRWYHISPSSTARWVGQCGLCKVNKRKPLGSHRGTQGWSKPVFQEVVAVMGERLAQINPVHPISLACSAKNSFWPAGADRPQDKVTAPHNSRKIGKPHLPRMRVARGWVRPRQTRRGDAPGAGAILRSL